MPGPPETNRFVQKEPAYCREIVQNPKSFSSSHCFRKRKLLVWMLDLPNSATRLDHNHLEASGLSCSSIIQRAKKVVTASRITWHDCDFRKEVLGLWSSQPHSINSAMVTAATNKRAILHRYSLFLISVGLCLQTQTSVCQSSLSPTHPLTFGSPSPSSYLQSSVAFLFKYSCFLWPHPICPHLSFMNHISPLLLCAEGKLSVRK